jgi:2-oxoisovalerate dehydrogenase E1 component
LPARLRRPLRWKDDALVVASFGDASANHSTATGSVNAACRAVRQGTSLPLLLVCEDNGLGLSTRTPEGWVQAMFEGRPGLEYRFADVYRPLEALEVARGATELARIRQVPVLLHLATVRIGGHAGSDLESAYRSSVEITADLQRDPLAATMRAVVQAGLATPAEVRARWTQARTAVETAVADAIGRPRLGPAPQVMAPLTGRSPGPVADRAASSATPAERRRVFGDRLPETEEPLTLAQAINRSLLDAGAGAPRLVVLGQDVARKGGVYGVTQGLQRRLGASRVLDTVLDEQTVLGLALGGGLAGLLPVPEIQYLAYLHNAEDQLRGEAASLQFFSQGAYRNPLLVRVAGCGRGGRRGLRHPRTDRVVPRAGSARTGRQRVAGTVRPTVHLADGTCADRAGSNLGQRPAVDHRDVRKRAADVTAGGPYPGGRGDLHPGGRPALAGPAAG